MRLLCCSLILPSLSYCAEVWGNTSDIKPLFILQEKKRSLTPTEATELQTLLTVFKARNKSFTEKPAKVILCLLQKMKIVEGERAAGAAPGFSPAPFRLSLAVIARLQFGP